jgi:hypothetical protein
LISRIGVRVVTAKVSLVAVVVAVVMVVAWPQQLLIFKRKLFAVGDDVILVLICCAGARLVNSQWTAEWWGGTALLTSYRCWRWMEVPALACSWAVVSVMKLFSSSLTKRPSNPECLSLASLSGIIYYLHVRLERSLPEWSTFSPGLAPCNY